MRTPVDVQVWRLSVLFLVGTASDFLFQFFRAFRAVFRPKSFGYHLLDALVALLFLGSLGAVVFIVNWGELRMYIPLSILLGALVTHTLVGNLLYRRAYRIFAGTRRGLLWSHENVIAPAKRAVGRSAQWLKASFFPPAPPPDSPNSPDDVSPASGGSPKETPPDQAK